VDRIARFVDEISGERQQHAPQMPVKPY
jgi:hypothetical protein